jgi:hypothetical protein
MWGPLLTHLASSDLIDGKTSPAKPGARPKNLKKKVKKKQKKSWGWAGLGALLYLLGGGFSAGVWAVLRPPFLVSRKRGLGFASRLGWVLRLRGERFRATARNGPPGGPFLPLFSDARKSKKR